MKPKITFAQVVVVLKINPNHLYSNEEYLQKVGAAMRSKYPDGPFQEGMIEILNKGVLSREESGIKLQTKSGDKKVTEAPLYKMFDESTGLLVAFWTTIGAEMLLSIPHQDDVSDIPQLFIPNVHFSKYFQESHSIKSSCAHLTHKKIACEDKKFADKIQQEFRDQATLQDCLVKTIETNSSVVDIIQHGSIVRKIMIYFKAPITAKEKEYFYVKAYSSKNFVDVSLNQIRLFEDEDVTIPYIVPKALAKGDLEEFKAEAPGHTMMFTPEVPQAAKVKLFKDFLTQKFATPPLKEDPQEQVVPQATQNDAFNTVVSMPLPDPEDYYGQPKDPGYQEFDKHSYYDPNYELLGKQEQGD